MKAIEYLRSREWSMGNGQCPDCGGISLAWYDREVEQCRKLVELFSGKPMPLLLVRGPAGHKDNCCLASSLVSLGQEILWSKDHDTRLPNELWVEEYAIQIDDFVSEMDADLVAAAATLCNTNCTESKKERA